jgi:AAA domain
VRYNPKDFRRRRPDGNGGWLWDVEGVRQVPYRLPEILKAIGERRTVFIVEGEKDTDALWRIGIPATCNAGGAGKWSPELNRYFRDADVVILPDQDPQSRDHNTGNPLHHADGRPKFPGQDHGKDVAAKVGDIASRIRILDLPGVPPKGDARDWIEAGGTADELFRLVESIAKPWAEYETPKGEDRPEASTSGDPREPSDWWRTKLIRAPDLCDQQFPDLKYVVPGIFPEGVTLLASRPKLGKSWLLLQVGAAVATGVSALVPNDSPLHGDVLYLALEDNPRRLQRRLTKYFGRNRSTWPARLIIVTGWNRLDQGGLEAIEAWCKSVSKPTLIMIDTLKKVRAPKRNGQSDYDADYEACQGLQKLAGTLGIAIIVAHHDRKMDAEDVFDTVSGTLGLTGGVDTIAVMKRRAGVITLHVEGRDLAETVEKAILFDRETCRWKVLGEAAEIQRSTERSRVHAVLATSPEGMSTTEIAAAADLKGRNAADLLLSRMVQDGEIERVKRGLYGRNGTRANLSVEKQRQKGQKDRTKLKPLKSQSDSQQSVDLSDLSHASAATDFDPQPDSPVDAPAREIEL